MRINVNFNTGFTRRNNFTRHQKAIFMQAAQIWAGIVTSQTVLTIDANVGPIDGHGKILGQASPTIFYPSGLPSHGRMSYDIDDIADMERTGTLQAVMVHEIAHVLGFGTVWTTLGLLRNIGPNDPVFTGKNAMREYGRLLGTYQPTPVPVANTGGRGTYGSHWREDTFDDELMTGYINYPTDPISRLTIASLEDLGYQVDYSLAQQYVLPINRQVVPAARPMHQFVSLPSFTPLYVSIRVQGPIRAPVPIGYSEQWRSIGAPVASYAPPTSQRSYLDLEDGREIETVPRYKGWSGCC